MTLVDTNVLLDVVTDDAAWASWSLDQLDAAGRSGPLFINPVIYAELSIGFSHPGEVDDVLARMAVETADIPRAALFLAGKAFLRYRRAGGTRTGVLPDFFIGAHAAASGMPVLTRDAGRFSRYFPDVQLIAPKPGGLPAES